MRKLFLILLFMFLTTNCFSNPKIIRTPKEKKNEIKVYEKMLTKAKSEKAKAVAQEDKDFWQREVEQIEGEIILVENDEM